MTNRQLLGPYSTLRATGWAMAVRSKACMRLGRTGVRKGVSLNQQRDCVCRAVWFGDPAWPLASFCEGKAEEGREIATFTGGLGRPVGGPLGGRARPSCGLGFLETLIGAHRGAGGLGPDPNEPTAKGVQLGDPGDRGRWAARSAVLRFSRKTARSGLGRQEQPMFVAEAARITAARPPPGIRRRGRGARFHSSNAVACAGKLRGRRDDAFSRCPVMPDVGRVFRGARPPSPTARRR